MLIESVLTTVIAVFAVFGFYCALRLYFCNLCSGIPAAVVLLPSDDVETLRIKLREAESLCLCGRCSVIVLIPVELKNDENIIKYVENTGYRQLYYIVER